jgi:hypothetical protein
MYKMPGRMTSTVCAGILMVSGLGATAGVTAVGQEPMTKKTDPPAASQKAPTVTVKGKVTAVTDATLTVVDDQKAETTIALDSTTKIMKAGKEASLADLKADDSVVIIAKKGEGDTLTAVKITVA